MRFPLILFSLLALTLAGCAASLNNNNPSQAASPAEVYPDLGEAPEWTNEVWLNTSGPLRLAELHGKVILLDMWTFG